jgi:hypothetical protein
VDDLKDRLGIRLVVRDNYLTVELLCNNGLDELEVLASDSVRVSELKEYDDYD